MLQRLFQCDFHADPYHNVSFINKIRQQAVYRGCSVLPYFCCVCQNKVFAVRTHAHVLNFDCHNFGWWMDWLDAMSVLTHVYAGIIAP